MPHPILARGLVACMALLGTAVHAQNTTITFPSGGCNAATSGPSGSFVMESVQGSASTCSYVEQGFTFGPLILSAPYPSLIPDTDVIFRPHNPTGTTISTTNGATFSLAGFDAGDGGRVDRTFDRSSGADSGSTQRWSQGLQITGLRADGTTVTQTHLFDGTIADFESFTLDGSFSDLLRVEILVSAAVLRETLFFRQPDGSYFFDLLSARQLPSNALLDNVQLTPGSVAAIPEPSTYVLMGLPLLAALAVRRRKLRARSC